LISKNINKNDGLNKIFLVYNFTHFSKFFNEENNEYK
ncbi:MAG: Unknown protein, partial [uncultured Sulfurovum sp.]